MSIILDILLNITMNNWSIVGEFGGTSVFMESFRSIEKDLALCEVKCARLLTDDCTRFGNSKLRCSSSNVIGTGKWV